MTEAKDKKRLLIATDNFLPRWDGISRFLSEIIPRLEENYEITVIAPDYGVYEDPNIRIITIPLSNIIKVGDFPAAKFKPYVIRKFVKQSDIVFCQSIGSVGSIAINAAKKYKKPLVSFIHSIEWELVPKAMHNILLKKYSRILAKRVAKNLYNRCDLIIMPSNNVAEIFMWNNIRTRSVIVNLGVDTEKFKPLDNDATRKELRDKLNIEPSDIVIGYHGRIGREKDLVTLLRAFTRLQNHYTNIKLMIVGDGVESVKKQFYDRKDVIMIGSKNNPIPYLQIMDIYCLTSLTETTCLSMLEAMSCKLACISTEVGFIRSYIKNGFNGLFFEKQNPYHLVRQIERFINDSVLRQKLGENARATVIERFSWDKTAKGINDALESLTEKK
ncbi:TPA: glycosyltransferase family 4 protein [Candidatus Woesearchaeota archaeon]|nr:glycosyltransferase family 4 protein [Candidatus Woesearchaeota archaeon]HIH31756.1 glycosyltransferase family 4 protein [Candidatus Woesearchaeota archaeon]HIH54683.1 glycosyltransferase family 4 protein [Candidatus Woesearchaeota archaeon]HIJ02585.1 glycosyltransferase family 4 protein [Candidatus Woesearchaeota archaeon]HIJ13973.1 glycosyltransferase family 4 protein [Candidatus Woesearchaeota archaeon]